MELESGFDGIFGPFGSTSEGERVEILTEVRKTENKFFLFG